MLARRMASPFIKEYLMTAGPTPLPPRVELAIAQPMIRRLKASSTTAR